MPAETLTQEQQQEKTDITTSFSSPQGYNIKEKKEPISESSPVEKPIEHSFKNEENEFKVTSDNIKEYGGVKLDDKGNVLDGEGKVVKEVKDVISDIDKRNFKPSSVWDNLRNRVGEKFVMPTEINKENEIQQLIDSVWKHTNIPEDKQMNEIKDPLVKDYLEKSKGEGFKRDEWLKSKTEEVDLLNRSDEDLIKYYELKKAGKYSEENKRGWKDDELADYIEELSIGNKKKRGLDIREELKAEQNSIKTTSIKEQETKFKNQIIDTNTSRKVELDKLHETLKGVDNIFGIEISEAEKNGFAPIFEKLVLIGEEGKAPIHEILRSNEQVYKLAYLLHKGENYFKDMIDKEKETVKDKIKDRLDVNQTTTTGRTQGNLNVDVGRLSSPQEK